MFMYTLLLCTWHIFTVLCTRYAFLKTQSICLMYILKTQSICVLVNHILCELFSLYMLCSCIQMQNHVMHTSRGSHSILVVCFLQILVLSSNTKKGEIERVHFILLWFCVLVNNTRIRFTWISKCCRNHSLHRNIGNTMLRPESPHPWAGVSALP